MSAALKNLETWEHTHAMILGNMPKKRLVEEIRKAFRLHRIEVPRCLISQGVFIPPEHLNLRNHPEVGEQIMDKL